MAPADQPARDRDRTLPQEARAFQGERAGIVTRVIANTVDALIAAAVALGGWLSYAALLFLLSPNSFSFPPFKWGVFLIATGGVLFVLFWFAWATTGRTYGNHLMGLRVVNLRGRKLLWSGAFLRAAFCVVFPIGLFWAVLSRENRSIQDTVLRTSVIYDWARGPFRGRAIVGGEPAGPEAAPPA